jgi:hypothetical protein
VYFLPNIVRIITEKNARDCTCSMHQKMMEEYKVSLQNLKGNKHLRHLHRDGRIILKGILET